VAELGGKRCLVVNLEPSREEQMIALDDYLEENRI
jgi:hypothetical protein